MCMRMENVRLCQVKGSNERGSVGFACSRAEPLDRAQCNQKQGEPVNAWCKQCDTQGFQCLLDVVLLRGLHSL